MNKHFRSVGLLVISALSSGMMYAVPTPPLSNEVEAAQQVGSACKGVVKDATGETVIGASVVVKGTTNGTITGVDGDFILKNVKKGAIIQISFVGYKTEEVVWNGQPLKVTLKDDSKMLGEVTVTALGLPKQAKSVGYATTRVSPTEIERTNSVNPVNALQGKVAGVQINVGGASGVTSSSSSTIPCAKRAG